MESLSNGHGDWQDTSFEITSETAPRRRWHAAYHDVRRFSLRDDQFGAGYVHPLTSRVTVSVEGQGSVSHQIVPRLQLGGRVDANVGGGWVVNTGLSERRYDTGTVRILNAGVDRYAGSLRLAYTAYNAFVADAGHSMSHAATIDHSYGAGEENLLGLTVSAGRELEQDVRAALRVSRIRAVSLRGRHWLGPRIGLFYTIGVHEQGSLYTRRGATAGIAGRF